MYDRDVSDGRAVNHQQSVSHDGYRWDSGLRGPIAEINELLLEVLRAAAATPPVVNGATAAFAATGESVPRLVSGLRQGWCSLDRASMQRLADCPYLLLDAGFMAPERWDAAALSLDRHGAVMDGGAVRGYFGGAAGVALLRRTLSLAWHVARSNPLSARMMFGMSSDCAERIGTSGLRHLEALAELSPAWMAPRWEAQPVIWRQMIQAAVGGSDAALRRVRLRGLQLMAALW
jgi:hypothetical protein